MNSRWIVVLSGVGMAAALVAAGCNSTQPGSTPATVTPTFGPNDTNTPTSNVSSTPTDSPTPTPYGHLYRFGGFSGGALSSTYSAPIAWNGLGTWTSPTAMPIVLEGTRATRFGGSAYVLGGTASGGAVSSTCYYAFFGSGGTLGTWATTNAMPGVRRDHAVEVGGSYVYAIGGRTTSSGSGLSTTYVAPISGAGIGAWGTTTSLPQGVHSLAGASDGSHVFAIAGIGTSGTLSTVYKADVQTGGTLSSWTSVGALPVLLYGHAAVVDGSSLYVVGGFNPSPSTTVYVATISGTGTLGSFSACTLPGLPTSSGVTTFFEAATVASSTLYALGLNGAAYSGPLAGCSSGPWSVNVPTGGLVGSTAVLAY